MGLIFWIIIFVISLLFLVKGSDWLVESAERIGLAFGLSPFIVGVTIVSIGTSFPELVSSLAATLKGLSDVAPANAIGSNISNILLIVGVSAILGRRLVVTKSLIDLDLPLLAIGTVLLLGVVVDGQVSLGESILLLITYFIYLSYTIFHKEDDQETKEIVEVLPSRKERRKSVCGAKKEKIEKPKTKLKDFGMLILGTLVLFGGAKGLVNSLVNLSLFFKISTGLIAITAVAVGTSLPELFVSASAALKRKSEVALGNIFGSNVFNALVVIGFSGLFRRLILDPQTYKVGLPVMALATFLFVISGISRRIHIWEGAFYLSLYVLFIAKLFNLF